MPTKYHRVKAAAGDVAVRQLVRAELKRHGGNVRATALALGCTRVTVRRARDGTLEDGDRTPHHQPRRTEAKIVALIRRERERTGYGRRQLARHLQDRFQIEISENSLKNF